MDRRLKSKKIIDKLFQEGKSYFSYPIKLVYLPLKDKDGEYGMQYTVSVSKRIFKKAVDRNRVKRQMREAIRLNLSAVKAVESSSFLAMMFIYVGKEKLEYGTIENGIKKLTPKLSRLMESNL
ncbi:MAG TPA: ribonuclease P protein component [Saprospiraceae bacterium]|nr:ribonuclease P protein component [Saprospiraceae bacterium]